MDRVVDELIRLRQVATVARPASAARRPRSVETPDVLPGLLAGRD